MLANSRCVHPPNQWCHVYKGFPPNCFKQRGQGSTHDVLVVDMLAFGVANTGPSQRVLCVEGADCYRFPYVYAKSDLKPSGSSHVHCWPTCMRSWFGSYWFASSSQWQVFSGLNQGRTLF